MLEFLQTTGFYKLFAEFSGGGWKMLVMIVIGLVLLWLAIHKKFEPLLLVGIAVGSLIGPYTSRFFSDIWLKRLFIVLALYVGTDYVLRGFFNYRIFG